MSHKKRTRSAHQRHDPLSIPELEQRWDRLRVHPQTRAHLHHLVEQEGVDLAMLATTALLLESAREEQQMRQTLGRWAVEEVRLLFLEEGCQHVLEAGRVIVDVCLTWALVQGPISLLLPLMVLGCLPLVFLIRVVLRRRAAR